MDKENKAEAIGRLIGVLNLQIGSISEILEKEGKLLFGGPNNLLSEDEIGDTCVEFLQLLVILMQSRNPEDDASSEFHALEMYFHNLARVVLSRGGRVDDLVRYVNFMQKALATSLDDDSVDVVGTKWLVVFLSSVFSELALAVFKAYLEEKERTIHAQEAELRETATPITEIWDGVLTLPIIGTLDSSRTMLVMEALLNRIASDRAKAVVMDLTGVKNIDSQVSHHLIQMVRAVQLMGSDAILTGIRPEIARALTSLNIDLGNVSTRASLSDGLKEAFARMNIHVEVR